MIAQQLIRKHLQVLKMKEKKKMMEMMKSTGFIWAHQSGLQWPSWESFLPWCSMDITDVFTFGFSKSTCGTRFWISVSNSNEW